MKILSSRKLLCSHAITAILHLVILIFKTLILCNTSFSQELFFRERFSQDQGNEYSVSPGTIGTDTVWKLNRSGIDWGGKISGGKLELTNDATVTTTISGWIFAYFDHINIPSAWNSRLDQNGQIISWTFNMRQARNDPSGFTVNNYGVAFILAGSTNAPFDSGFGYAVVCGQSGSADPIRLIRYSNGLSGSITDIIMSNTSGLADFGNEYLSIEVRYTPHTNQWELLVRNDGTNEFKDPNSGIVSSQGFAIDNTYTSTNNLKFTGCYWCGNTATSQNAIFDNIQISGGCAKSNLYYRTKKSGAWHDAEIWEMSNEENGLYRPACFYPNNSNAKKVRIIQTDTVRIESGEYITTAWLNIDSGATCSINQNASLDVTNGNPNGADLEINGTLIDDANAGYGINFLSGSGSSWMMGAKATLIRSNSSSAIPYRDNYQNGMVNIPATANWIIRYEGKHVPFTTIATAPCPCNSSFPSATFYPNLIFESNSGLWNSASSIGSRFNGTNTPATIKGNLLIGGQSSGDVFIYNENTNNTPILITGDLIIKTGSMLSNYNPIYPNQPGTGFEVKGNIIINGTLQINGSGNIGKLVMSGSLEQTIAGNGNFMLHDLIINHSEINNNSGILFKRPVTVNGILTLRNGLLHTSPLHLLTLTENASCPEGGNVKSFVNGPMQKYGSSNFNFPVGKSKAATYSNNDTSTITYTGGYRPIGIANLSESDLYTAEYHLSNPYLLGQISEAASSAGLQSISSCEYWDLKGSGNTKPSVTLSWSEHAANGQSLCNADPSITDSSYAVVVPFFNGAWGDKQAHYFGRTSFSAVDSLLIGSLNWGGEDGMIDHYEKFVIGSTDPRKAILSMHIKNFKVVDHDNEIQLEWEIKHHHLMRSIAIEKSSDGLKFEVLKEIRETINKENGFFNNRDTFPFRGWNYYRLRITDKEGKCLYSEIRKVMAENKGKTIKIIPNPGKDYITVNIYQSEKPEEYIIMDRLGNAVIKRKKESSSHTINISTLVPGLYYLRFRMKDKIIAASFIKE